VANIPLLVTEAPLAAAEFPLRGASIRIGRAIDAGVRLDHPLVDARHAMLLEREDGWWISAAPGRVQVNAELLVGDRLLRQGDRIQLAPGAVLRFESGAPPVVAPPPRTAAAPSPKRTRRRWRMPRLSMPSLSWHGIGGWLAVLVVIGLAGGFGWYAYTTWGRRPPDVVEQSPLTVPQATQFDSLLTVAYDHIERGQMLLEFGANAAALDEFATGIATITTSALRSVPYVQARVEALRASVADGYRSRNLSVPGTYATAKRTISLATSGLTAALSADQFAASFASMQTAFSSKFGDKLVVTGADHAEHLSLYGPGGALDLRSATLRPDQLQFVISEARSKGIRVKDFSQDSILRVQIAAAIKAGVADRAGTGLHLHIDRFANRRDRFTLP
jgi:hypothetical protein